MEWADVEVFVQLKRFLNPQNIYGIGNAFGFSTLVLSTIWSDASVDIIDAGTEGANNKAGIDLTNKIANDKHMNVKVFQGLSPKQVPSSMRSSVYELAFIDGAHFPANLRADFGAVLPYMAERCIIVCHDIGMLWQLSEVIYRELAPNNPAFTYVMYHGSNFQNFLGTGFFHRGFSDEEKAILNSLGKPCPWEGARLTTIFRLSSYLKNHFAKNCGGEGSDGTSPFRPSRDLPFRKSKSKRSPALAKKNYTP